MASVKDIDRLFNKRGKVLTVSTTATIAQAAEKMTRHGVGCLVVTDFRGRVIGIITERDIIGKVVAPGDNPAARQVAEIMITEVISCTRSTPIEEAKQIMGHYGIRHLPIIENGVVQGMLSSRDIMAHQLNIAGALAQRQSQVLQELERQYPGITRVEVNEAGWTVL